MPRPNKYDTKQVVYKKEKYFRILYMLFPMYTNESTCYLMMLRKRTEYRWKNSLKK